MIPEELIVFLQKLHDKIISNSINYDAPDGTIFQGEIGYVSYLDSTSEFVVMYFPIEGLSVYWKMRFRIGELSDLIASGENFVKVWRCPDSDCPYRSDEQFSSCPYCEFWHGEKLKRPGHELEDLCATPSDYSELFFRLNPGASKFQEFCARNNHTPGLQRLIPKKPFRGCLKIQYS